jgi:uncharacterized cupredoxin-like copper-binding protein
MSLSNVVKSGAGQADKRVVRSPTGLRRAHGGLFVLAVLAAACSSTSTGSAPATGGRSLAVKVSDFKITAPAHVAAGRLLLRVHNAGPDMHELLAVRSDGRALPLRGDNLTVDEDALKARTVGELEDDHPGSDRSWTLTLAPGTYEVFCNMSGHYLGGMHTKLVVA